MTPRTRATPRTRSAPPVRAAAPETSSAVIAPHIIRYLLLVADERGLALDRTLRAVSLTRATLDSPAIRVSYRQGREIIAAALRGLNDPALGLTVGSRQPITASGVLGLAMMSSATLADAVAVGVRFQNLAGSMVRWHAVTEGRDLVITATTAPDAAAGDEAGAVTRFLVEEGFANITRMARDAGNGITPIRVELSRPHPGPAEASMYAAHFGVPVRFGSGRNAWVVDARAAGAPLPAGDRWAHTEALSILEAQTHQIVERQELVAILAARIEDALPEVLPCSAHAQALATSERTLRRRLAEAGAGYGDVLDEVRRSLAARLLALPDLALSDISFRLGYTDERSLRRSVRRWFGMTPHEFRRSS